jgi:hypothetical protein
VGGTGAQVDDIRTAIEHRIATLQRAEGFVNGSCWGQAEDNRDVGVHARRDLYPQIVVFTMNAEYLRHPARRSRTDLPLVQSHEPVVGDREGLSVLAGCRCAHGSILKTA